MVHKKCHKAVGKTCTKEHIVVPRDHYNGDARTADMPSNDMLLQKTETDVQKSSPDVKGTLFSIQNFKMLRIWCFVDESVAVKDSNDTKNTRSGSQCQYSLQDFDLIGVIGRGSYAKVLMVELKRTKRLYAMKVIKKSLVSDDEAQTEKYVFDIATNHPFLVGLHSCFQTPSRLFFVIEFVRGGDLTFHVQRQGRLPEEHAR